VGEHRLARGRRRERFGLRHRRRARLAVGREPPPARAEHRDVLRYRQRGPRRFAVPALGAAGRIGTGPALSLGSSESQAGGRLRATILADACEALVGAVYLDGGYAAAEGFIARFWKERMLKPPRPLRDPKTMLQEWAQARGLPTPAYRELARTGPHHNPKFRVAVELPDRPAAEGQGSSKRAAEQAAAAEMLAAVGVAADKIDG